MDEFRAPEVTHSATNTSKAARCSVPSPSVGLPSNAAITEPPHEVGRGRRSLKGVQTEPHTARRERLDVGHDLRCPDPFDDRVNSEVGQWWNVC